MIDVARITDIHMSVCLDLLELAVLFTFRLLGVIIIATQSFQLKALFLVLEVQSLILRASVAIYIV